MFRLGLASQIRDGGLVEAVRVRCLEMKLLLQYEIIDTVSVLSVERPMFPMSNSIGYN